MTLKAHTRVPTQHGEKYAVQLCKHFRHKVEASYDGGTADVDFKFATAKLAVTADALEMSCEAGNLEGLARAKFVLEDHLLRFSWREKLAPLSWEGDATPPPPVRPGEGAHED